MFVYIFTLLSTSKSAVTFHFLYGLNVY